MLSQWLGTCMAFSENVTSLLRMPTRVRGKQKCKSVQSLPARAVDDSCHLVGNNKPRQNAACSLLSALMIQETQGGEESQDQNSKS